MTLKEWREMIERLQLKHGEDAILWLVDVGGMPEVSIERVRYNGQPAQLVTHPWWRKP